MLTDITTQTHPARLVLEGVPRVHFYEGESPGDPRCPEDLTLPSVFRAILEFLGESDYGCKHCPQPDSHCKIHCTYSYLVGVTGIASFLSWKKGWEMDNVANFYMSEDASAPEQRALDALGYNGKGIKKTGEVDDEALFRQEIIASLQAGMPVVAYGVIGPPEACIITGYDQDGEVLIGWNFFQNFPDMNAGVDYEPDGYFRKSNWFKSTQSLLIIGDKKDRPSLQDTYLDALRWALVVTRTPMVRPESDAPEHYRQRFNGLAAYQAWADQLLQEEDFTSADEAALRHMFSVHDNVTGTLAEARWYGSQFLMEAVENVPYSLAEDLLHAAAYYAAEHDLMWKVWGLAGGLGNPEGFRFFGDPSIRHQIADIILQARDKDAQAAASIEKALSLQTT